MAMNSFDHSLSIMPETLAVRGGKIVAYGETAAVLEVTGSDSIKIQRQLWTLKAKLDQHKQMMHKPRRNKQPTLLDVVLGNNNITVIFDPLLCSFPTTAPLLKALWEECCSRDISKNAQHGEIKRHKIKAYFGGEFGPDLTNLAKQSSITPMSFVESYCQQEYLVMFLGFQPGFAYLHGLTKQLHSTRMAEPRTKVPIGSIAIGGSQTGIYPSASPGGWQIIGRVDASHLPLFDFKNNPPNLFQAGDRISFSPKNMRDL